MLALLRRWLRPAPPLRPSPPPPVVLEGGYYFQIEYHRPWWLVLEKDPEGDQLHGRYALASTAMREMRRLAAERARA
jgi:hypothetical protein